MSMREKNPPKLTVQTLDASRYIMAGEVVQKSGVILQHGTVCLGAISTVDKLVKQRNLMYKLEDERYLSKQYVLLFVNEREHVGRV